MGIWYFQYGEKSKHSTHLLGALLEDDVLQTDVETLLARSPVHEHAVLLHAQVLERAAHLLERVARPLHVEGEDVALHVLEEVLGRASRQSGGLRETTTQNDVSLSTFHWFL